MKISMGLMIWGVKNQEFLLYVSNLKNAISRIQDEINKLTGDKAELARAFNSILAVERLRSVFEYLDSSYDELSAESEKLLDSPDANTEVVMKRRRELTKQINEILELKDSFGRMIPDIEVAESYLKTLPKEIEEKARRLIEKIETELNMVVNPISGNN